MAGGCGSCSSFCGAGCGGHGTSSWQRVVGWDAQSEYCELLSGTCDERLSGHNACTAKAQTLFCVHVTRACQCFQGQVYLCRFCWYWETNGFCEYPVSPLMFFFYCLHNEWDLAGHSLHFWQWSDITFKSYCWMNKQEYILDRMEHLVSPNC